jgi:urea transport system substrate-binding protein
MQPQTNPLPQPSAPDNVQLNRRALLRSSGSVATLAAAHAFAPFLFSGCQRPQFEKSAPEVPVGILHSQTGPMKLLEIPLRDAELLAIDEINAMGGVRGHRIVPYVEDTHSNVTEQFPRLARKLLTQDNAACVFGCLTSSSRKAVLPVLEETNGLLFYPVQYEGNESSYNVVYTGALPNQQILPAIDWLTSEPGGRRKSFYLVGSDYVFPWTVHHIIKKYFEKLAQPDVQIVGHRYVPLNHTDFTDVVEEIQRMQPDVIFNTINGISNQAFFQQLSKGGISPSTTPVMSTSVGENTLQGIPTSHTQGHYATWSYFQSLDTPKSRRFVQRFRGEHGSDRVLNDLMEAAYSAVYLWKIAAERADSFDVNAVRNALTQGITFDAPSGPLRLDPKTLHCFKHCRIGRIQDNGQFEIVHQSAEPIEPLPYPDFAFPGWKCDWSREGLTRGPDVAISKPL